jgi:hypothetical protein
MAGPIDPRTLAIIRAMEPAAMERQAIMARDAVMRGPAPAPMNPVFRPGMDAAPVMPAGLTIAPQGGMPPGFDEFADVRNPIPQPRGPMTAPQPSAADLMPPPSAGQLQPMPQSFETPIGPAPSRMVPPPMPAPAGNMLAPDIETGSVAPAPAPAPVAPPAGNRLEAPMPAPIVPGRRVYDPAAGTNQPRFIYEGGPAPMPAAGGGSAIATGGGAVPAVGGAGAPAAAPASAGGSGFGDGFMDFLGGFSRGGLLGGIQGIQLGKQARAKAGQTQQGINQTIAAARRMGIPDDMVTALTATGNTKALVDVMVDVQKQNMTPKEAKAPDLQEIFDPETGRRRMAIIQPDGTPKFVGGVEAPESDVLSPEAEAQKIRLANAGRAPGAPDVRTIRQADGSEVAVQWDPAENAWKPMPAPEGGASVRGAPRLTETQSKDVGFYNRGIQAADRLNEFEAALLAPVDAVAGSIPLAGNFLVGKDKQRADQAGREFLAVILRKDTGAAVTPQEMDVYGKMYIPAPGDSAEVLAQKREARQTAIESIRLGLGNVGDQVFGSQPVVETPPAPGGAPPPAAGGDALSKARDAIAKGADRNAVIERLRQNGIDPSGL